MVTSLREFLSELWHKFRQDHVQILVSSLAYYTFFSFFPLLLLLASVLGFLFGLGGEYARFSTQLVELLPFSSIYIQGSLQRILHARVRLGISGSLLLLWSATAAFDVLQQILNRIHRAPKMRSLWRRRLLGILLATILMLFVPLSIAFVGLRPLVVRALVHHTPLPNEWEGAILSLSTFCMGVMFNFLLFATLYLFGPSVSSRLRRTWVGALVAAILWEVTKSLFAVYVKSFSSYQMLYGSVGSVIAVLIWLYLSGALFALGAEINSVLALRRDRHPPATH
jgi:membrane protein